MATLMSSTGQPIGESGRAAGKTGAGAGLLADGPRAMTTLPATFATAITYTDRSGKARYIADKYRAILGGSVLDVGCDQKQLAQHLPRNAVYTGLDLCPPADITLNLDRHDLPMADRTFDAVIAADVLEHLDRLHGVFDELCRVSREHVIISLPNPLRNLLLEIARGSEGRLKYYGLPVDPPRDRHRWFFGAEEAAHFLRERGKRNGMEVVQMEPQERGGPSWRDSGGRELVGTDNARWGTLWCVLRRTGV
jgi:SAM-dependent methyltransferase